MSYTNDLPAAARRHVEAADALEPGRRRDVAGYLYGIAAECAVKAMMIEVNIRQEDLLHLHFPELRTRLRDVLQGRRGAALARLIFNDSFLNNWHVRMRYASAGQVRREWVDTWKDQARAAVNAMGTT